jgi:hypothetical protein
MFDILKEYISKRVSKERIVHIVIELISLRLFPKAKNIMNKTHLTKQELEQLIKDNDSSIKLVEKKKNQHQMIGASIFILFLLKTYL